MRGVYVLANDGIYEHFIAFIKSFRKHNPDLPLTVIMFDENISKISALSEKHKFNFWNPAQAQTMYNAGLLFYPDKKSWAKGFKKLSSFWGVYDTFLCLDADVVVLADLNPVLEKFERSDYPVLFFDFSSKWVYKNPDFQKKMTEEFGSRHICAGTYGAKKNALTEQQIANVVADINQYRNELVDVIEQPFLNYCIDINRLKKVRLDELDSRYSFSCWYNLDMKEMNGEVYWIYNNENKGQMVAIHWAGCGFSDIYKHPSAGKFLEYRLLNESIPYKYKYFLNFYHLRLRDILFNKTKLAQLFKLLF